MTNSQTVTLPNGRSMPLDVVAHYMDDELRESLVGQGWADDQAFCDAYYKLHLDRYGAEYDVN